MNADIRQFTCVPELAGRLDKFLVACLPEFSRARLQGLIRDGCVDVSGKPASKAGQMVEPGARVEVRIPATAPASIEAEAIPLDVIYEDANLLVVNKPAGLVVHPAAGHAQGTLVNAVLAHAPSLEGISGERRPGVVHRLDKDTSGIILVAKNDRAHHWLQDQFRLRKVKKTYLALVDGHPPTPNGRIEVAIGRNPLRRKEMAVMPDDRGRAAISEYFTKEIFPKHTLIEVHPQTGRTHQIRVHLAFLGCPVVGDRVYGYKKPSLPVERQFLHASALSIHLEGETGMRTFSAPLPADMEQILRKLRTP